MEALKSWLGDVEEQSRRLGRPVVTLSYAQSLDGCLTLRGGQPTSLSQPETRRLTHEIRAAHDGILVGIGTILADNPQLNVRLAPGNSPQPVVLDTSLRIPDGCHLLNRRANLPWIAVGEGADAARSAALEARGVQVISMKMDSERRVSLHELLPWLYRRGIHSLMVEGGAKVITSFLVQRLVDRVVATIAPVYLGGLPVVDGSLAKPGGEERVVVMVPGLENPHYERMGDDLVVYGLVTEREV